MTYKTSIRHVRTVSESKDYKCAIKTGIGGTIIPKGEQRFLNQAVIVEISVAMNRDTTRRKDLTLFFNSGLPPGAGALTDYFSKVCTTNLTENGYIYRSVKEISE
jgi:hypothetical protein